MTPKDKVYISGRITGEDDLTHFDAAATLLEDNGYIPVNPERLIAVFVHNEAERSFWMREERSFWMREERSFWMRECIKLLLDCDYIYFCSSKESDGMRVEREIAAEVGIPALTTIRQRHG